MNDINVTEQQDVENLTDEQLETVDGGDFWGNLFGQIFGSTSTGFGGIFGGSGTIHIP